MTGPKGAIDRTSPVPIHFQLRQLLEDQISSGRFAPGDRLPSEPILSEYYHVSRTTVRQALYVLVQKGLIHKEKGRGAFVSRNTPPGSWHLQTVGGLFEGELSSYGVTVESTVLRGAVERLPDWATQALQLGRGTPGVTLERVRRIDGEIAVYVVNHMPAEYADLLPEIWKSPTASLYGLMRDRFGVTLASSSRLLEAVGASPAVASRLRVSRGFPVAFIQSTNRDANAVPKDCYRVWLRTDRLQLSIETQTWESSAGQMVSNAVLGVPAGVAAGH